MKRFAAWADYGLDTKTDLLKAESAHKAAEVFTGESCKLISYDGIIYLYLSQSNREIRIKHIRRRVYAEVIRNTKRQG